MKLRSRTVEHHEDPASHDRQSAAAYVAHLSADLAAISRQHGLETLGYLLDMARLEAEHEMEDADDRDFR
jgi:hypothetical protein